MLRDPPAERKLRAASLEKPVVLRPDPLIIASRTRVLAGLLGLWLAIGGLATLALVASFGQTSTAHGGGAVAALEVVVFPQPVASRDRVDALRGEIAALPGVTAARVLASDVVVEEALRRAGGGPAAPPSRKALVPDIVVVSLDVTLSADAVDRVVTSVRGLAAVDAVVGDLGWFRQWETMRLQAWRAARALGALAGLLALGALIAASALFARAAAEDRQPVSERATTARRAALVGGASFAIAMAAAAWVVRAVDGFVQGAWASLAPLVSIEPAPALHSPATVLGAIALAAVGGALATTLAGRLLRNGVGPARQSDL